MKFIELLEWKCEGIEEALVQKVWDKMGDSLRVNEIKLTKFVYSVESDELYSFLYIADATQNGRSVSVYIFLDYDPPEGFRIRIITMDPGEIPPDEELKKFFDYD